MSPITLPTHANDTDQDVPRNIAFERAHEAMIVIRTVQPMLTPSQLETLALLLDNEAMVTIQHSIEEAKRGEHRPLSDVVEDDEE